MPITFLEQATYIGRRPIGKRNFVGGGGRKAFGIGEGQSSERIVGARSEISIRKGEKGSVGELCCFPRGFSENKGKEEVDQAESLIQKCRKGGVGERGPRLKERSGKCRGRNSKIHIRITEITKLQGR